MSDVLVLCYHAVSPTWTADLSITPEALDWQLRSLVKRGWQGATFGEATTNPPGPRTLVVTFDDAFLSVLELARPILDELGLPATVFAPTAFMAKRQRLRWPGIEQWERTPDAAELEAMRWGDLRRLVAGGWEVGSHTRTHPRLTQLDDSALRDELERSRQECSDGVGVACRSLAYPYGDVDDRVARAAASAGYTVGASLSSNLAPRGAHRWPRVGVYHGDVSWRFRLKVDPLMRRARASRAWPVHE